LDPESQGNLAGGGFLTETLSQTDSELNQLPDLCRDDMTTGFRQQPLSIVDGDGSEPYSKRRKAQMPSHRGELIFVEVYSVLLRELRSPNDKLSEHFAKAVAVQRAHKA
jgi:hypothetical protein